MLQLMLHFINSEELTKLFGDNEEEPEITVYSFSDNVSICCWTNTIPIILIVLPFLDCLVL